MHQNLLSSKDRIKRNLLDKAKQMWNISNIDDMDPLVKLLIDSLSFELSKVGQSIMASNSKILETLASLLVPGENLLASPAHAVMKVLPLESNVTLDPKNQFYLPNGLKRATLGKIQGDLYFSTINEVPLINAQVKWMASERSLSEIMDGIYREQFANNRIGKQFPDGEIWLGIEQFGHSQMVNEFEFYLDLQGDYDLNELLRFNEQITFEIIKPNGEVLKLENVEKKFDIEEAALERKELATDIIAYYKNRFVVRSTGEEALKVGNELFSDYPAIFKEYYDEETLNMINTPCLWMRVQFPEKYNRKLLQSLKLFLNCFVVINKRMIQYFHNINRSGTILPLETLIGEHFLSVGKMTDQKDKAYNNLPSVNFKSGQKGNYKIYYGGLESFDVRKGMLMLEQLTYKVREEGNAFSSMAQDTILIHLKDLYDNLEVLENKMARVQSNDESSFNTYILTFPEDDTEWIEYEYWTTNADLANGLEIGTELQQYRFASLLHPTSIRLVTATLGGKEAPKGAEKINELRHLVLAKNRLVSGKDIDNYIEKEMGHLLNKVEIKPGVHIHPDKKKGLIRVTDILLHPKPNLYSPEEWTIIVNGLEKQIRSKAIRGQKYYVSLVGEKQKEAEQEMVRWGQSKVSSSIDLNSNGNANQNGNGSGVGLN